MRRRGLSNVAALSLRLPIAIALAATLAVIAHDAASSAPPTRAGATAERPNVLVVLTDDQTVGELSERSMPVVMRKLAAPGAEFTNSFVSSPLCCPSRAGDLTGEYPHNSGVYDNEPGYPSLNNKTSTVYGWMQAAGYRTGHVDRFLLNYDRPPAPGADYDTHGGFDNPPGVEDWFGYVGSAVKYYGATFSDNGTPVQEGNAKGDYSTRVANREARDFISDGANDPRPFFLVVAPNAPHSSNVLGPGPCGAGGLPIPDHGEFGRWKNELLPEPPSFGEPKIRDKPHWIETRPKLTRKKVRGLRLAYRCALGTLSTVDNGVRGLTNELKADGELDNTAIFFTSDNGYFFGEHRITLNKVYPYEEGIRVPLIAKVPNRVLGLPQRADTPSRIDQLVNNLDLTATILDLGGATPCTADGNCRQLDGHSLLPLLRGNRPDWSHNRALLMQVGGKRACDGSPPPEKGLNNFYDEIRTKRHAYIELNRVDEQTGFCPQPEYELYDLKKDPYELHNQAHYPGRAPIGKVQRNLAARLAELRNCAGSSCG
jgi:N-acetylglucosamine-6-sulfatase